jgi:RNA polymerase sigma-54 factor
MAAGSAGDSFRAQASSSPARKDWLNRDLGSRTEIEQTLDTGLDNVFSEEPAEAAAACRAGCRPHRLYRMGRRALERRRLQSGSLCRRRSTLGSHLAEQLAVAFPGRCSA